MREKMSNADKALCTSDIVRMQRAYKYIKAAMRELIDCKDTGGELAKVRRAMYNVEDTLWPLTTIIGD